VFQGQGDIDYFVPIVADAEAGFGGVLNAYELMKAMIEAGAAGVHFEDQLASVKKCGHMGGKVLVPTQEAVQKLVAARLAADVMGVPTIVLARTDADAASLLTSDIDERDKPFLTGERTAEGFWVTRAGMDQAISRDWPTPPMPTSCGARRRCPTSIRRGISRRRFERSIPTSCWPTIAHPSFNWKRNLDDATIARFQRELGAMGYKYQFITLAGIHSMWYNMFDLAQNYVRNGMTAYVEMVQEKEFAAKSRGYTFLESSGRSRCRIL
jgi:isocitrate lyase